MHKPSSSRVVLFIIMLRRIVVSCCPFYFVENLTGSSVQFFSINLRIDILFSMFFCFNEDVFKEEDVFFLIITKLVLNLLSLLLFVGNVFQEMFDDSFFMCIIINFTCDPLTSTFLCYLDEAFNDSYLWTTSKLSASLVFIIFLHYVDDASDDSYVWTIVNLSLNLVLLSSCVILMKVSIMPMFGPSPSSLDILFSLSS